MKHVLLIMLRNLSCVGIGFMETINKKPNGFNRPTVSKFLHLGKLSLGVASRESIG